MYVGGEQSKPWGGDKDIGGDDIQGTVQGGGKEKGGGHDGDRRTPHHIKACLVQNHEVMTHQVGIQFGQGLEISLYKLWGPRPDQSLEVFRGEDGRVTEAKLEFGLGVRLTWIRGPKDFKINQSITATLYKYMKC